MKGYSLECIDGKVFEAEVLIAWLKVIPGKTNLSNIYEFKKILDDQGKDGEKEYLVKWKYYNETSWQPMSDFLADDAIQEYNAKRRKLTQCVKKKWGTISVVMLVVLVVLFFLFCFVFIVCHELWASILVRGVGLS